ncbi:ABC transporter substrate-binding protein [Brevibacterium sp.]|uniref:ABC transporter substrate-binding protein n=1 Tax=Brevibacterium sp. TaxID=1701 RepID=UPI002812537C|nr:ABC transporter substrate-binding protein [Brevibacterium sp.]
MINLRRPVLRSPVKRTVAAAGTAALVAGLAACGGSSSATTDQNPEQLTIAASTEPKSLDPADAADYANYALNGLIYSPLFMKDEKGEPQPVLAKDYSVSEDKTKWTINLKEGISFSDGTPFNAEAVCYNVDRLIDPESSYGASARWNVVDGCETISDSQVVLDTGEPYALLMTSILSHPPMSQMVSPSMEEFGDEKGSNPVGTGPYKITNWANGSKVSLEKNPEYNAEVLGEAPVFDTVEWRIVAEDTTRVLQLESGEVDFAYNIPSTSTDQLESNGNVELIKVAGRFAQYSLNATKEPFDDVKVRQAANHAVNKEQIAKELLNGEAKVATGSAGSAAQGFAPVGQYEYDPEKAKKLLEEAGAVGAEVAITTPVGRYPQDKVVAEAVTQQLNEVGFKATTNAIGDWPTLQKDMFSDKLQTAYMAWSPGAVEALYEQWDGCTKSQWALGHHCVPKLTELREEASAEFDEGKRAALEEELQQTAFDQALGLYMFEINDVNGQSTALETIYEDPMTYVNFLTAKPKEG